MVETIYYTQTHNILPGLAVRSSRYLPRKAAMVRMTSQGERFGTEGSIPSLGTKRSDAHDSTTSEFFIRREVAYLPQGRKPDKWRFESSSGHQTQGCAI